MMKILITGASGQVGHSLVKELDGKAEVLATDKHALDITNEAAVANLICSFRPDYIINAAAYTAVDGAEEEVEVAFSINRDGPKYLAEAAKLYGAVMLHLSTDYVFDGVSSEPYKETDIPAPQSVYGASKLAGELAITNTEGRHVILRTAWVFSEYGDNFVKTMLRLGKQRDLINVVNDQLGGPTYATDIAKALVTIIEQIERGTQPNWGIYHYAGSPHVSWHQFALAIFKQAANSNVLEQVPLLNAISTCEYPTLAIRPANSRLNCDKIVHQFGIAPSDWKKALTDIQSYK